MKMADIQGYISKRPTLAEIPLAQDSFDFQLKLEAINMSYKVKLVLGYFLPRF